MQPYFGIEKVTMCWYDEIVWGMQRVFYLMKVLFLVRILGFIYCFGSSCTVMMVDTIKKAINIINVVSHKNECSESFYVSKIHT